MIGRAATSAVRRVCSMFAPASKSTPTKMNPDLNQFFKRFTTMTGHGYFNKTLTFTDDPSVKYTASGEFSRTLEVETLPESDNDKPIFYLSRTFLDLFYFSPISLEDDGRLSPRRPIFVPSQFQLSKILFAHCYNFNGVFVLPKSGGPMFAWNPTTSEYRELPVSPHNGDIMLGEDVAKCSVFVATWPDPNSEDYKVLNVFSYEDCDYLFEKSYPIEFELYSHETDSWKKLRWEGEFPSWQYTGCSCYINGVIYMKIWDKDSKEFILCFDFPNEIFFILPLPAGILDAVQLVKYNGQLSVFSAIKRLGPEEIDMAHWVRKNGEWVEVGVYHLYGSLRKPIGFARNDELLLFHRYYPIFRLYGLMVFDSTTGVLQHVPYCVTKVDYFKLLDFHDTSSLKLKLPSGDEEKDGRGLSPSVITEL